MKAATIISIVTAGAGLGGLTLSAPSWATNDIREAASQASPGQSGLLQCVPYARRLSGIEIYGDAHTWWEQAAGKYARGSTPQVGAVMNFRPHGNSRLGHVAAVSRILDSRTVLIRHANWSVPGGIEDNVRAVDVSPDNDWSEVRVWYGPAGRLGASRWPLYGFIYNEKPGSGAKGGRPKAAKLAAASGEGPRGGGKSRNARALSKDPIGEIIAARR